MSKLRMAVIGTGHMGRYHVNLLAGMPDVELVCIVDKNEDTLMNLSNKYEVKGLTEYDKIIKKVDAAVIAVPTSQHYAVAKEFLAEGKHLLIEKPLTVKMEDGQELMDMAKKKGLILQVGHVERFNAAVQQLKKIVKHPYLIESRRCGPMDKRIGDVGVVMDLMIHDIDIIINLVNDRIKHVNAVGYRIYSNHEDVANAQIQFENGCVANITASRVTHYKERSLKISQKDLFVALNYGDQDLEIHRQASSTYLLTPEEIKYSRESFVEKLHIQKDNPLKLELQHFVNCVNGKEKPLVTNENDLVALGITNQILEKIRNGNA
jgi:predicted dehydrogenase